MRKTLTYFLSGSLTLFSLQAAAQPANDDACSAETVTLGTPVTGSCDMATIEMGEVSPPNDNFDCINEWCDGSLDGTVWYIFTAPASGNVIISSCNANNEADSQFALYTATDCADFSTFMLIAANDDKPDGCTSGSSDFASELVACGLVPGELYYLQIDGYGGDPSTFELTITDEPTCPLIAHLQFFHSSPDLAVETVDIRLNGDLIVDDLSYGEASEFILVEDISNVYLTINPANSVDDASPYFGSTVTLPMQSRTIVPIVGIYSTSGYNTTFTGPGSFGFTGIELPEEPVNPNNQHIAIFNNVTDVAGFRYFYDGVDAYGPLQFTTALSEEYLLTNHPFDLYAMSNPTHYGTFLIPFEDYIGESISVITSGFADPAQNSGGPGLSMCVVHADGTVDCFENTLGLDDQTFGNTIQLYPNPSDDLVNVRFSTALSEETLVELTDLLGKVVYSTVVNDLQTGEHSIVMPTAALQNGTYYLRLKQGTVTSYPKPVTISH